MKNVKGFAAIKTLAGWLLKKRTTPFNERVVDTLIGIAALLFSMIVEANILGLGVQIMAWILFIGFTSSLWLYEIQHLLDVIAEKLTDKPAKEVDHGRETGSVQSDDGGSGDADLDDETEAASEEPSGDSDDGADVHRVVDLHQHRDGAG